MDVPEVRYARSGDISVAYQLFGEGDIDLVVIRGSLSELESAWEQPLFVRHLETLGSIRSRCRLRQARHGPVRSR